MLKTEKQNSLLRFPKVDYNYGNVLVLFPHVITKVPQWGLVLKLKTDLVNVPHSEDFQHPSV